MTLLLLILLCDNYDDDGSDDNIGTTKVLMLFAEAEACFSNKIGLLIKTYIRNDLVEDWCCARIPKQRDYSSGCDV